MIVRPATAIDAGPIARVQVVSWQAAYRDILPADYLAGMSIPGRKEFWEKLIVQDLPKILVAIVDEQVVGFSALGPCRDEGATPTSYEIRAFYVSPSHWSLGVGRELWLASREALLKCGAASISLWVIANNARAIRFYRLAGFAHEANSLKSVELGGAAINEVRYVCDLSSRFLRT